MSVTLVMVQMVAWVIFGVVLFIELSIYAVYGAELTPGVRLHVQRLPSEYRAFLRAAADGVVDGSGRTIRRRGTRVYVTYLTRPFIARGILFPYSLARIDLNTLQPRIEYLGRISLVPFWIALAVSVTANLLTHEIGDWVVDVGLPLALLASYCLVILVQRTGFHRFVGGRVRASRARDGSVLLSSRGG